MDDQALPLVGVRVIDLTSNIAAPYGGAVLADLGAEVVHVESPGGDDSRRMSPAFGDESAYFHVVNRNKSGLRLDIREPVDRARLDAMIADADVFLCNLRPSKLTALGLDAQTLCAQHPRLIHGMLGAYGTHGAERDKTGYDAVLQARTGIAAITGTADGPPVRAGVSILDVGGGTWLALGVIAALYRRERTGRGGAIGTSLFETGANWVAYHLAAFEVSGQPSGRHGSGHPAFSPYGIFPTRDGQVCLGIGGDAVYRRLCAALDAEHLATDPRYATNGDRVRNDQVLRRDLQAVLDRMTTDDVIGRLTAAQVPADAVNRPEDLLNDPQALANDLLRTVTTDDDRMITMPGLPITIDGARPAIRSFRSE